MCWLIHVFNPLSIHMLKSSIELSGINDPCFPVSPNLSTYLTNVPRAALPGHGQAMDIKMAPQNPYVLFKHVRLISSQSCLAHIVILLVMLHYTSMVVGWFTCWFVLFNLLCSWWIFLFCWATFVQLPDLPPNEHHAERREFRRGMVPAPWGECNQPPNSEIAAETTNHSAHGVGSWEKSTGIKGCTMVWHLHINQFWEWFFISFFSHLFPWAFGTILHT